MQPAGRFCVLLLAFLLIRLNDKIREIILQMQGWMRWELKLFAACDSLYLLKIDL